MANILLVEDNDDNRILIKEILEDTAHTVFSTGSAENGMEILNRNIKFDLVLMDVSLPNLDGYEATRILKKHPEYHKIPVIIVTAHAMNEDRNKAFAAGCDAFLTKPVDEDLLLETIDTYLKKE